MAFVSSWGKSNTPGAATRPSRRRWCCWMAMRQGATAFGASSAPCLVGKPRREIAGVAAAAALDAGRAMRRTVSLVAGRRVGYTRAAGEFALDVARLGGRLRFELRVSECTPFAGGFAATQGVDVVGRARVVAGRGHSGVVRAVGARGSGVGIGSLLDRLGGGAAGPAAGRAGTGCAAGRLQRSSHCLDPGAGRDRQWTARLH